MGKAIHVLPLIIIVITSFSVAYSADDPQQKLEQAYMAVLSASENRGDVTWLVDQLNMALTEIETGADPVIVAARLDAVIRAAEQERARGIDAHNYLLLVTGGQLAVLAVLIYATWSYFPRLFWRQWINVKGDWIAEHEDR